MNAADITRRLAVVGTEGGLNDGYASYQVLGPVNGDSTSFVLLGTYTQSRHPEAVFRVTVERIS